MGLTPRQLQILKKGLVRQNWSRLNLFNLVRLKRPFLQSRTLFQQKWSAKAVTRAYHGEHLTKRQWANIFKHSLKSVVTMNTRSLAASDGSEYSAGRGGGEEGLGGQAGLGAATGSAGGRGRRERQPVPYMNQTFAPMERRLDMAVFRAMFASSALQARQYVVHGFVRVNGKLMKHPQYMLNPGDMFSVELDRVLMALGQPKPSSRAPRASSSEGEAFETSEASETSETSETPETPETPSESASEPTSESASEAPSESTSSPTTTTTSSSSSSETPSDSTAESASATEPPPGTEGASEAPGTEGASETTPPAEEDEPYKKVDTHPTEPWLNDAANVLDASKPYLTPWQPRDYLSAFAFIPKYLEVNHNTGHAVYLRDPVASPGRSEVPTPFTQETMQLAYNWFLRRR